MKKRFMYALMSAITLTGSVGFSSCTDDEVVDVNPSYDPEANTVVVDLAFNISTANTPTTRMSAAATQATTDQTFRGISDAKLFTFYQIDGGTAVNGEHLAAATTCTQRYDLADVIGYNQITKDESRRVLEMSLPLRTNTLVFYGKATTGEAELDGGTNSSKYSTYDSYGLFDSKVANSTATDLSNIIFSVKRRLDDNDNANFKKTEKLLAGLLSCIMNTDFSQETAAIDKDATPTGGSNKYDFDIALKRIKHDDNDGTSITQTISWSDYASTDGKSPLNPDEPQKELEKHLGTMYKQMTTIYSSEGELRAASGQAILSMIADLWTKINSVRCADPFHEQETVAKYMAQLISEHIQKYFTGTPPSDGGLVLEANIGFQSIGTMVDNFLADKYWPVDETNVDNAKYVRTSYELASLKSLNATQGNIANFPESYNLPVGATHITFATSEVDNHKLFTYPKKFSTVAVGGVDFYVEDYMYPPELVYFGNSPIRVSNKEHLTKDYPNGANTIAPVAATQTTPATVGGWDNSNSWSSDWKSGDEGFVQASTRSVAMQYDINYGTALLKTTISYPTGISKLKDNNHAIQKALNSSLGDNEEPDNEIEYDGSSFTLKGIIIGGQSKNVGWDFIPKKVNVQTGTDTETGDPIYTNKVEYGFIYDKAIAPSSKSIPNTSNPVYTLLFDNYDATLAVDKQSAVFVALELVNNCQDFYGNKNLIKKGGSFYLIGKLDPQKTGLTKPTWPTYHKLPPYATNGTSIEAMRVFMQDYMTSANFVIGEKSLQSAYLTVPDLRSSSLSLGLSVNIEWSTGIDFGDVTLGNTEY